MKNLAAECFVKCRILRRPLAAGTEWFTTSNCSLPSFGPALAASDAARGQRRFIHPMRETPEPWERLNFVLAVCVGRE